MQAQSLRQLPFDEFQQVLIRERSELSEQHARFAGMDLAETLVARRVALESLSAAQKEKMRKRFGVESCLADKFFQACKDAIPFELGYQLNASGV